MAEVAEVTKLSGLKYGPGEAEQRPPITVVDDFLEKDLQKRVFEFLNRRGWKFGWKSTPGVDPYAFWHKHFAGNILADHVPRDGKEKQYDCAEELQQKAPLLHAFWLALEKTVLKNHALVRCYANGQAYGSDGSLHTDSISDRSYTSIYYPHERWSPNWAGETVFFNKQETDSIASIYPKPNRFLVFQGTTPHVARGVSRICPVLRITLMFKTELSDGE